jgi:hypothetical protein
MPDPVELFLDVLQLLDFLTRRYSQNVVEGLVLFVCLFLISGG